MAAADIIVRETDEPKISPQKQFWNIYREKQAHYPELESYLLRALTKLEVLGRKPRLTEQERENYIVSAQITRDITGRDAAKAHMDHVRELARQERTRTDKITKARMTRMRNVGRRNREEQPLEFATRAIVHGEPFNKTRIEISNDSDFKTTLEAIKPIVREILLPIVTERPVKVSYEYKSIWHRIGGESQEIYTHPRKEEPKIIISSPKNLMRR